MKVVFAQPDKKGLVFQKAVEGGKEAQLLGKKIGDKFEGAIVGLEGYELQVTGGTDNAGFPMRRDIVGQRRVKALISSGSGVRHVRKGSREKRNVAGSTVGENIAQLNAKIVKAGAKSLEELGFKELSKEERAKKKAEKEAAKNSPKAKKR